MALTTVGPLGGFALVFAHVVRMKVFKRMPDAGEQREADDVSIGAHLPTYTHVCSYDDVLICICMYMYLHTCVLLCVRIMYHPNLHIRT